MKIVLVNGSPKTGESASQVLIDCLLSRLEGQEVTVIHVKSGVPAPEVLDRLCNSDALVLAFPLYADTLPSHMIHLLTALEAHGFAKDTVLYGLVNNGFFEGDQNIVAVKQLRAFAKAAGISFGQAVGIGAGELHRSLKSIPFGRGPNKNPGKALDQLAAHILHLDTGEDLFTKPNCPRGVWNFLATSFKWHAQAKKNGLRKKDLYRRLNADELL